MRTLCAAWCAGLCAVSCFGASARGEGVSSTSAQLLYGGGFHDSGYGNDTNDGRLATVTLEHFGTWAGGDNYFFVDLRHGEFLGASGEPTDETVRVYGEWGPRLSLLGLLGRKPLWIVRDLMLAGQLDRDGDGFWANLLGAGLDFDLPGGRVLGVNVYARDDKFNAPTVQVTAFWEAPFLVGPVGVVLRGYVDVAGTDDDGVDVNAQPQLLLDVGRFLDAPDQLQVGIEWYYHRNDRRTTSAPQGMVRWIW